MSNDSHSSRRRFLLTTAPAIACRSTSEPKSASVLLAEFERESLRAVLQIEDLRFDMKQSLLTRVLGPGYRYHTTMREYRAHPTRESADYALYLLESNEQDRSQRAFDILSRVLSLQDTDPRSKWYGIWGWYAEEPPPKMAPADWNWADFIGSTLLLTELRHGSRLPADLRERIRAAILHAARSVQRRDVSMRYTNIAVMGTFVTLAASELLGDSAIGDYARRRIVRLAQAIDETSSFEEYNSPTYARVTLANLARIRTHVSDEESRALAAAIEHRLWLHLASHWDSFRAQFAGPMSRCYSTDLGAPLWLEKACRLKLGIARPADARDLSDADVAINDYRCPEDLLPRFLNHQPPTVHHELFQNGSPPVVGTTWIETAFSLGSVNRGDLWNQRRGILAYFGAGRRPVPNLTVRLIKDGYDFSSGLLFTVQEQGFLLGAVNFANPGGNRHISLDPVKEGRFKAGRLFLEFDFDALPAPFQADQQGESLLLTSGVINAWISLRAGAFGAQQPRIAVSTSPRSAILTADLLPEGGPHLVEWAKTPSAWLLFTIALAPPGQRAFALDIPALPFSLSVTPGAVSARWQTPETELALSICPRVQSAAAHTAAFRSSAGGAAVPVRRLSTQPLAPVAAPVE